MTEINNIIQVNTIVNEAKQAAREAAENSSKRSWVVKINTRAASLGLTSSASKATLAWARPSRPQVFVKVIPAVIKSGIRQAWVCKISTPLKPVPKRPQKCLRNMVSRPMPEAGWIRL